MREEGGREGGKQGSPTFLVGKKEGVVSWECTPGNGIKQLCAFVSLMSC